MKHSLKLRESGTPQAEMTDIIDWLKAWQTFINRTQMKAALPMFDRDVVSFGSLAGFMEGLEQLERDQWARIWPTIKDFEFDLESMKLFGSADDKVRTVALLWSSLGRKPDGGWYDRRGRCTLVLERKAGRLVCTHSHFSMEPGIPPALAV